MASRKKLIVVILIDLIALVRVSRIDNTICQLQHHITEFLLGHPHSYIHQKSDVAGSMLSEHFVR